MPTLARLSNCVITLYANDHPPPHFHVRSRDGREALVTIDDMTVISGLIKRRGLLQAMQWAQANSRTLIRKWRELNR